MARCRKCNAEIPEGKELCAECEQLNNESYLDSLLHTVASDDQITQEAENAKKIRFEKMKARIASNRENKPRESEPEPKEKVISAEPLRTEDIVPPEEALKEDESSLSYLPGEALKEDESSNSYLSEEPPVEAGGFLEAEEPAQADDFETQRFGGEYPEADAEPPQMQAQPEPPFMEQEEENRQAQEEEPDKYEENTYEGKISDEPAQDMPNEPELLMREDFMKEKEEDRKDRYMLTPEEEAAFEVDAPDDFIGSGDWEHRDYDILGDDTASDDEFDRMLQAIADTGKAEDAREGGSFAVAEDVSREAAAENDAAAFEGAAAGKGTAAFEGAAAGNDAAAFEGAAADDSNGLWAQTANVPEEDNPSGDMDMDIDLDALLAMDETEGGDSSLGDMGGTLSETAGTEDFMKEGDALRMDGWDDLPGERDSGMAAPENEAENTQFNEETEPQEDILDLINSLYNSEGELPPDENGSGLPGEQYGTEDELERSSQPKDIADIFPDALGAVPDDGLAAIADIGMTENGEEEASGKKKKKKKKKENKPGILKKLFGNIKAERSEEEIAQMKEKIIADAEAKAAAEEAKKKKAAADQEAKKKKAEEKKAAAAKKKQEEARKKAEAAKLKKDEKEKKKQEVQNLIDAIDEDEGRINRVGASIIFVIFAALAAFILIGTNVYSYNQSIANAEESFEYKHYNEAYEEIAGLDDVKEEDENFILQVMTVMYTYKQLNSFNHYYDMGLYPQALDSLLKGLQRYDKYSALATIIEVEDDLDFVRGEILDKLEEVYSLTEQEAVELAAMGDREAYTQRVYEIAGRITEKQAAAPSEEE